MFLYDSKKRYLNVKWIQLLVDSQEASMSDEAVGPVLGQHGLSGAKFCAEFNERSFFIKKDVKVKVLLYFFTDHGTRSFNFFITYPLKHFLYFHCVLKVIWFFFDAIPVDLLLLYKSQKAFGFFNSSNEKYYGKNDFSVISMKSLIYGLKKYI